MWHDGSWDAGDWVAMSTMMLLFWIGLIALVIWLARLGSSRDPRGTHGSSLPPTPDEILADRFARGEIDEDEFLRRRRMLHDSGSTA